MAWINCLQGEKRNSKKKGCRYASSWSFIKFLHSVMTWLRPPVPPSEGRGAGGGEGEARGGLEEAWLEDRRIFNYGTLANKLYRGQLISNTRTPFQVACKSFYWDIFLKVGNPAARLCIRQLYCKRAVKVAGTFSSSKPLTEGNWIWSYIWNLSLISAKMTRVSFKMNKSFFRGKLNTYSF